MNRFMKSPLGMIAALMLSLNTGATEADVVAVVSANNPVNSLSRIELINIFLGKSAQFPDGTPATPIDLHETAPDRQVFYAEFDNKSAAQIKAYWSKMIFTGRGRPPQTVADGEALRQLVAKDPNAIGYLGEALVDDSIKVLTVN